MSDNIKVAFITPSVSRSAGGIFEVELALAKSLSSHSCDVHVYGQLDENTEKDLDAWNNIPVEVYPSIGPHAFRYSPQLQKAVVNAPCEVAHLHVMWMFTSIVTNSWHRTNRPYIITIHGMLEPWALRNAFWKKKLVHFLYEGKCLQNATCIHAHTYKEYLDIRKFGLKNPVCIIPNGIDLPQVSEKAIKPKWFEATKGRKVLLYLGRIHPKKGLEGLIDGWEHISKSHPEWCLVIAGWGEQAYELQLKHKVQAMHLSDQVLFVGPQFKEEKEATFSCADAFILPSFSEGLPMAILEAWAYRKPSLYTAACNIPEGYTKNAGVEISSDAQTLAGQVMHFFKMSDLERNEMGNNGYELVAEKFSWNKVGQQMAAVYGWLTNRHLMPDTVIID